MENKFIHKPITISSSGSDDEICAFHLDSDGRTICDVWVYSDQDEPVENAKAIANLFAAAPDLYDCLSEIMSFIGDEFGDDLNDRCKAALAKAKGVASEKV